MGIEQNSKTDGEECDYFSKAIESWRPMIGSQQSWHISEKV